MQYFVWFIRGHCLRGELALNWTAYLTSTDQPITDRLEWVCRLNLNDNTGAPSTAVAQLQINIGSMSKPAVSWVSSSLYAYIVTQKNTISWINSVWMPGHRRRRWPSIKTTLVQCLVFAGVRVMLKTIILFSTYSAILNKYWNNVVSIELCRSVGPGSTCINIQTIYRSWELT